MATSYSPNLKLAEPAVGDTGWGPLITGDLTSLDALAPVGGLAVTTCEVPSASLNVAVAAGNVVDQGGNAFAYSGITSTPLTASSTYYLFLDGTTSWTLSAQTTFPTSPHVRLATVSTGTSTISSITDSRQAFNVCGSIRDSTTWSTGLTHGLTIGATVSQKLGFYGATPVIQPSSTTDLRTSLINLGLYATGGASPLNLNGGALTVGSETIADGGAVSVGLTTGTTFGSSTSQKIGFYGVTAITQSTGGSAVAGSSYTTSEQGMINRAYSALRSLGLLS